MTERRRVAILGGTFDPVHNGHLALITAARDGIAADGAWLLPARTPALREEPVAPAQLRLAMLEAAVRDLPGVRVEDIELRRAGVSYTIDTLAALRVAYPDVEPWWVLGGDAVRRIGEWQGGAELRRVINVVVVQRVGAAGFGEGEARSLGLADDRTVVLDLTPPAVSASEVRRRVAAGEPISALVPRAVADIIAASGLYGSASWVR
jgi:nicotinate-nucleotide adenylyltransferase